MKTTIPFDDYNHRLHPGAECVGTVLPTWGNFALTNGWKLLEIYDDIPCDNKENSLFLQNGDRQD